jgi:RNA polymerase sigma-70 factor (ECF subfamily)
LTPTGFQTYCWHRVVPGSMIISVYRSQFLIFCMAEISTSSHGTSLLVRLRDHETQAWNELVELYGPLIFHWCISLRLQSCDAADVMQDVFTVASNSIQQYQKRPVGSLRGWLWTITQNKVRDFWRKQKNQINATGGTEANWQFSQIEDGIDDEPTGEAEECRLVHRALALIKCDFHEQTWTAFWRSTIEGQDNRWIAEEMGLSPNSVRQAKSRVLRRLREQLGEI